MIILDMPQLSPEWFSEHAGKPGASSFNKIVTMKGEPSKQREGYLHQLAAEAITGKKEKTYMSAAMAEGIERENESRLLYELMEGVEVHQVGMVYPDEQKRYLCSPDGLVNDLGKMHGLEMKNVIGKTQVAYLLKSKLPSEYFIQVQGSMLVTGFKRWDFFSYHPGLSPLHIKVKRDENFISKLAKELDTFCDQLALTIKKLNGL